MREDHPAAHLQPFVVELRRRALLVVVAFGAVVLARVWDVATREWSLRLLRSLHGVAGGEDGTGDELARFATRLTPADQLVNAGGIAITVTFAATAVVFLRWVHRLVLVARALGADLAWDPSQAVWGFFVPFLSLIRPYQVLFSTHTALAPAKVAEPPPRVDRDAQTDYRSVAFLEHAPGRKLPRAWIGFWWIAFLLMSIGGQLATLDKATTPDEVTSAYQTSMVVSLIAIAAAAFGITVVRGLTARAEERFRRIRQSTPEALAEQGIDLR
jgi:hypothetical protein